MLLVRAWSGRVQLTIGSLQTFYGSSGNGRAILTFKELWMFAVSV
jgi:hypothetical protein